MYESPFPGMDPYLESESSWEIFHGWFIRKLAEQCIPQARALNCYVNVERTVYGEDPDGRLSLIGKPDMFSATNQLLEDDEPPAESAVPLAAPKAVHEVVLDPDEIERHRQQYIFVRHLGKREELLAAVELLSFSNKRGTYAKKYREKRALLIDSGAHFMEIDFVPKHFLALGTTNLTDDVNNF